MAVAAEEAARDVADKNASFVEIIKSTRQIIIKVNHKKLN